MTATHPNVRWFAGDDWQINATLLDENGNPFDLTQTHMIKWALMNGQFQRVLDDTDVSVTLIDAIAGQVAILVPAAKTSGLVSGNYSDSIRIIFGGFTSTLSYGPISVSADPWAAPVPAAAAMPAPPRLRLVG
jgi:hypothetical protein